MTTVEHIRSIATSKPSEVSIAGVPWPTYKVVALVVGFLVALVVAIVSMSASPAILAGAGVATLAWLAMGSARHYRR